MVQLPPARWRRIQWIELTDLPQCPAPLRKYMTDYLATVVRLAKAFDPLAPVLAMLLLQRDAHRIVDLCSGGGGPWPPLADALGALAPSLDRVVLTDAHPLTETWSAIAAESKGRVVGYMHPVDARAVPSELGGVRTIFDGFHHFPPEEARRVLADAAAAGAPILIAEGVERSVRGLIAVLVSPLLVWLCTPLVRPFSLWRLLFTYVLPVVPLAVLHDGVVSCLRAYRAAELLALTDGLSGPLRWEANVVVAGPARLTTLVGRY